MTSDMLDLFGCHSKRYSGDASKRINVYHGVLGARLDLLPQVRIRTTRWYFVESGKAARRPLAKVRGTGYVPPV